MRDKVKRVFIIGIDGAGNAVRDAYTPCIDKFLKDAVISYNATTSVPTISGECWGALFHGVGPEKHGITNEVADTQKYDEESPYPSFMKVVRQADQTCKLASFSGWDQINRGIIEESCNCDFGTGNDKELTEEIVKYINNNDPKVLFVQLDSVDGAGHSFGYRTPKYYDRITEVDSLVGNIINAIKESGYYDESSIILCSDHGGGGDNFYSHGSNHYLDKTIFWAYKGINVIGGRITETNINIKDTAAVVVSALGLECPKEWDCKIPNLNVI